VIEKRTKLFPEGGIAADEEHRSHDLLRPKQFRGENVSERKPS
jgi:hypothetical protein